MSNNSLTNVVCDISPNDPFDHIVSLISKQLVTHSTNVIQDLEDESAPHSAVKKKSTESSKPTREPTIASMKTSEDTVTQQNQSAEDGEYNDDFEGDDMDRLATPASHGAADNARPGEHDISPFVQVCYTTHVLSLSF